MFAGAACPGGETRFTRIQRRGNGYVKPASPRGSTLCASSAPRQRIRREDCMGTGRSSVTGFPASRRTVSARGACGSHACRYMVTVERGVLGEGRTQRRPEASGAGRMSGARGKAERTTLLPCGSGRGRVRPEGKHAGPGAKAAGSVRVVGGKRPSPLQRPERCFEDTTAVRKRSS